MKSLKNSLILACIFLGSFTTTFTIAEDKAAIRLSFEARLDQLELETSPSERLHQLFNLHWEWLLSEFPSLATHLGYTEYNDKLPDYSLEAFKKREAFLTHLLNVIQSIDVDQLTGEDVVNYKLFRKDLELSLEAALYPHSRYMPINQMDGIHLDFLRIIEIMPTNTVQDYDNILKRLKGFSKLVDETIVLMNEGLKAGVTPPRIALRPVPQQILNHIVSNPFESCLFQAFRKFPSSISSEEQKRLVETAVEVYSQDVQLALIRLYSYLVHDYIPQCRSTTGLNDLPKGSEWYQLLIRQETTTDLTAKQIHEIGLAEVDRVQKEMLDIIESLQFKGSFKDFLKFLKQDPQFFYPDRQSLLKGYRDLTHYIESRLPTLFNTLPQLPFEVCAVPDYCEEGHTAAYYYPGSLLVQRPGQFFINTGDLSDRPKWEMEVLALHEAVPGHHLQISLAQEIADLPEFRKHSAHFTAYVEGWGLYAEGLGKELGLDKDPYSRFGRLTYEMLRSIRLVVDTGLHSMGWTRQQAIDYFKEYVGLSDQEIRKEVDRYLAIPGQALAYKIGELKLKALRQKAESQLGEAFDIRAFHDELLKHGALPLDILEDYIDQWIEQESAQQIVA